MDTISNKQFQNNPANAMDKVVAERNPLIITRESAEPVVLMRLADFHAHEQQAFLREAAVEVDKMKKHGTGLSVETCRDRMMAHYDTASQNG